MFGHYFLCGARIEILEYDSYCCANKNVMFVHLNCDIKHDKHDNLIVMLAAQAIVTTSMTILLAQHVIAIVLTSMPILLAQQHYEIFSLLC